MDIMIEGDDDKEPILKAAFGSVAIWKRHILITSEESLYYCDISEFLDKSEKSVNVEPTVEGTGGTSDSSPGNGKQNLYLKTSQFIAVQMSDNQNRWRIKGLHETQVAGECALVCENTQNSILVFFKIVELKAGFEEFQALDPRQMLHIPKGSKQKEDSV